MKRWFPDGMPQPMASTEALPWWEAAAKHKLVVQRCGDCAHMQLPPAPICSECRSSEYDFPELSGRGEVYTFTTIHRPIALDQEVPFVVAVITLEGTNGVRMISNVVDTPLDEIAIGMPVELVWEDMSEDLTIPRFRATRA